MFRGQNSYFSWPIAVFWIGLSFQAGAVNAAAFLSLHRFVSHVTGFASYFGVDIVQGRWAEAFEMLSVPLFFILGSMVSALFIERRIYVKLPPRYDWVLVMMALILFVVGWSGHGGFFGQFKGELNGQNGFLFLASLALVCGMQNAIFSETSGAVIRTTHLTGTSTDLGVGLMRVLGRYLPDKDHVKERRLNWLRIFSIISFVAGSAISTWLFARLDFLGLFIPATTCLFFAYLARHRSKPKELIVANS